MQLPGTRSDCVRPNEKGAPGFQAPPIFDSPALLADGVGDAACAIETVQAASARATRLVLGPADFAHQTVFSINAGEIGRRTIVPARAAAGAAAATVTRAPAGARVAHADTGAAGAFAGAARARGHAPVATAFPDATSPGSTGIVGTASSPCGAAGLAYAGAPAGRPRGAGRVGAAGLARTTAGHAGRVGGVAVTQGARGGANAAAALATTGLIGGATGHALLNPTAGRAYDIAGGAHSARTAGIAVAAAGPRVGRTNARPADTGPLGTSAAGRDATAIGPVVLAAPAVQAGASGATGFPGQAAGGGHVAAAVDPGIVSAKRCIGRRVHGPGTVLVVGATGVLLRPIAHGYVCGRVRAIALGLVGVGSRGGLVDAAIANPGTSAIRSSAVQLGSPAVELTDDGSRAGIACRAVELDHPGVPAPISGRRLG